MTIMRTLAVAAAVALLSASTASARVYDLGVYQGGAAAARSNYERFGQTGYARDGDIRNTCYMLCRRDSNPCDPPEFKRDGRCDGFD